MRTWHIQDSKRTIMVFGGAATRQLSRYDGCYLVVSEASLCTFEMLGASLNPMRNKLKYRMFKAVNGHPGVFLKTHKHSCSLFPFNDSWFFSFLPMLFLLLDSYLHLSRSVCELSYYCFLFPTNSLHLYHHVDSLP